MLLGGPEKYSRPLLFYSKPLLVKIIVVEHMFVLKYISITEYGRTIIHCKIKGVPMHLGSIYLIVKDFNTSIQFYEKLLKMSVSAQNMQRFAQFEFDGKNISIMNGCFDAANPHLTVRKGEYVEEFDNLAAIAEAKNTHKFVLNFWTEDLEKERERINNLNISDRLTQIKYIHNVKPYYYFQLTDPDGNIIEITGQYSPKEGEFVD